MDGEQTGKYPETGFEEMRAQEIFDDASLPRSLWTTRRVWIHRTEPSILDSSTLADLSEPTWLLRVLLRVNRNSAMPINAQM
jgi:hypothetical protein